MAGTVPTAGADEIPVIDLAPFRHGSAGPAWRPVSGGPVNTSASW